MNKMVVVLLFAAFFLTLDFYLFQAVITISKNWSDLWKTVIRYAFWVPSAFAFFALLWVAFGDPYQYHPDLRKWAITGIATVYLPKVFGLIFLLVDDLQRGVRWVAGLFTRKSDLPGQPISRSEFLSQAAVAATAIPLGAMVYGIVSGAHDYRVRRVTLKLPNLPKSFDGLTIGQVSDIHSGSFWNKTAVKGGVEMLLGEKPDVIFFTGDLVNNETSEVKDYFEIFNKLRAPMGVFSITGNHDYGDYKGWGTLEAKQRNFKDLIEAHKLLGYDLLLNEHCFLQQGADKIAIIGNENWGVRFSKYGKLNNAYRGTEEAPVKLLLSHDPTHWDAEVRPYYPDIDATFSGHTHGFQFGVEVGNIKWSPVQYVYKQWGGLYQEANQYLYVNRGFGYLAYPGRVGMPPELTIFKLVKG